VSDEAIVLRSRAGEGGSQELLAPSVGVFTPCVASGQLVSAGQSIGTLEVLGVRRELSVPSGIAGRVTARVGGARTRVPVQYGDALLAVSSDALAETAGETQTGSPAGGSALSFDAPMSGRFYGRPSPTEPAFVTAGDSVKQGQTIGLLEVMKTFNRLVYQGETLPAEAVVERIVPEDGADVVRGEPVLYLAPPKKG
jgi:acetyl-CoA carboxylase biotin carboxyl carrier protein